MNQKLSRIIGIVLLSAALVACSSAEEKAAEYIENAEALLEEGALKKAEIEYRNALQINQNQPDAWFGLSRVYEQQQESGKAYALLNKIRKSAPGHLKGRIRLAEIMLATNQTDQALSDAREILELAPGDARAHELMAAVQFRLNNFQDAREEVEKALAIDPTSKKATQVTVSLLIAEKKYDEALSVLDKASDADPEYVPVYMMKARVYQSMGDQKSLENLYLSLIERFPEDPFFPNALAHEYLSRENIDGAERVIQQHVESMPANVNEKLKFVAFKQQYRSPDDAIALLKTYIDADKDELEYRFLLGRLYRNTRQNDLAMAVYREIIKDDGLQSAGLAARNELALMEGFSGNIDKAKILVAEVLNEEKGNESALLLQTGFRIADQQYEDAIVSARTVLRNNPDSIKALGLQAQAHLALGSTELAVESLTTAFRLSPETPAIADSLAQIYLRQRKPSRADGVLQGSIEKGNRTVDTLKLSLQAKIMLSEWGEAERLARILEGVEGQEVAFQQALGLIYQGKEQQAESLEAFKRAHELSPNAPGPLTSLVQALLKDSKIEEAKRFLSSVVAANAENPTAYGLLAQLALLEKKTSEATKYFNKVVEVNPKASAAYIGLARINMANGEFASARAVLERGLVELPGNPGLSMGVASTFEKQKEYGKAIEVYEALLLKHPDLPVAKNNLASLLTDQVGDQASLDRAVKLSASLKSSKIPQFRDTYAWASVLSGTNMEEAIVVLKNIVKKNADDGLYNFHLGEAFRRQGDTEKATSYLKKAIDLVQPGSDVANQATESLLLIN